MQILKLSLNVKLVILSAVLCGIAQPGNSLGLLVFVSYIPLFYVLLNLEKKNKLEFVKLGVLFGVVYTIVALYWIALSTVGGFIGALITISLRYSLFFFLYSLLVFSDRYNWLIIALFVIQEYTCQFTDLDFAWHIAPYSITDFPFLCQIAEYTGIFGISLFIFTINFFLVEFYRNRMNHFSSFKNAVYAVLVIKLYILVNFLAYLSYKSIDYNYIKVGIIQPNIDAFEKWKDQNKSLSINRLLKSSKKAIKENADFILWPETSVPFYLRTAYNFQNQLSEIIIRDSVNMVIGSLDYKGKRSNRKYFNSVFHFLKKDEFLTYNKQKLVAVAEKDIIPDFIQDYIKVDGASGFTKGNENTVFKSDFNIYDESKNFIKKDSLSFASIVCIESNFPGLISNFKKNGMQFLNIITNDGWFYPHYDWAKVLLKKFGIDPYIPSKGAYQHNRIAIMRAIENRASILRSANTGISSIIDPGGYFTAETDQYVQTEIIDFAPVPKQKVYTFYNKHGDYIVFIMILTIVIVLMNLLTRKYKEEQSL